MYKDFYIFRHGETDYNCQKRWQGCGIDSELNATGITQAQQLAEKLKPYQMEIIYTSALKRAIKTAEIVAAASGIGWEVIPDLREGCFGQAEGMCKDEIIQTFPEASALWFDQGEAFDVCFPGGETRRQIQERMLGAVRSLLNTPYCRVGITSHGSSIRYLLMYFGYQPPKIANTALYHLIWEDGHWTLET